MSAQAVFLNQPCNHGTHVAGIAAGRLTSNNFFGVARDANLVAIQVFSRVDDTARCAMNNNESSPCVRTWDSDYIKGLERVFALKQNGMNIASANMSLGSRGFTGNCDSFYPDAKAAIDNLRSVGVATVVASGNDSYIDGISEPACISSAVSVGNSGDGSFANGSTALLNQVMNNSNSASFLSLLAPGRWITSSVPGGGYEAWDGTSMAAPHVAGAWAVLKQRNPNASVTQILNTLANTGIPILDSRNNITKPRIRVDAALSVVGASCLINQINVGQTINGQLLSASDCSFSDNLNHYFDYYTFNGTAGQQIAVSKNSSAFDTYLYLLNSSGQIIAENDDSGGNTNSRIPATSGFFTLPADGTYSIWATSYDANRTGAYSINLTQVGGGTNNRKTTGVFRPSDGITYMRNSNTGGVADISMIYGVAGDQSFAGDWDGDGIDSIGIYRNGVFYLKNSNIQGVADLVFALGNPGDEPIAGDWDGLP